MKKIIIFVILLLAFAVIPAKTNALSLKITPVEYKATLKKGERQKGFVDVTNPTASSVIVNSSVQAFRQLDSDGSLQFYDDQAMTGGVRLDLDEFEIPPFKTARVYFIVDGTKLPAGDVFGAIFFNVRQNITKGSASLSTVRVGTILSIINGTPGSRAAAITRIKVPSFVLGDEIRGEYTIKNTSDANKTTGFYPTVKLKVAPFGETKAQTGKLVFAGHSRDSEFTLKAPWFGFYNVSVGYADAGQSTWVFVARPLAILLIILAAFLLFIGLRLYRRRRNSLGRRNTLS